MNEIKISLQTAFVAFGLSYLLTQNAYFASIASILACTGTYYQLGGNIPERGKVLIQRILGALEAKPERVPNSKLQKPPKWGILVGNGERGQPVYVDLKNSLHWSVFGTSGYGKTTLIHGVLCYIAENFFPSEMKVYLTDLKGVDLTIYGFLPHLAMPVAQNERQAGLILQAVLDEMEDRMEKFNQFSDEVLLCNNIHRYEELTYQKFGIRESLPYLFVVIDEIAMIEGDEYFSKLEKIAKLGRAYGIVLVAATQEARVESLPKKITSQFDIKFCSWMPSALEYRIAQVPNEVYAEGLEPVPGRFFFADKTGWKTITTRYLNEGKIQRKISKIRLPKRLKWPADRDEDNQIVIPDSLVGQGLSMDEKTEILKEWGKGVENLDYEAIMMRWNVSLPTAKRYLAKIEEN